MAPAYKLTYFNSRGLTEPIRFILAYAGVDYEDVRVDHDKWPELKASYQQLPFGKLPILEFDGNVLAESKAIARYLAKEHGLAGKNNLEQAKVDGVVDAVGDVFLRLMMYKHEADETKKEALKKTLKEETVPTALNNFQNILQKNGKGHFVGDSITWADLTVLYGLQTLLSYYPTLLDKHDALKAFVEKTSNIPSIKAWVEKRPVTEN